MSASHASTALREDRGLVAASPAFDRVERAAFAAKGVLYLAVAAAAIRGDFAHPTGASRVLEGAIAALLVVAAAYKLIEAIACPDVACGGSEATTTRVGRALAALIYSGLAVVVFEHLVRGHVTDEVHWTARLLERADGPLLVSSVGVGAIGFGLHQLYRAFAGDGLRHLIPEHEGPGHGGGAFRSTLARRLALFVSGLGYAGRGIAAGLVGGMLVDAAVTFDIRTAPRGVAGAIEALHHSADGNVALRVFGAGMTAYALFCFLVVLVRGTRRTPAVRQPDPTR
ncbi:MAG: DUF1206 domain-containing protein [Deltaproteobacteria bacterium]|nr:DUF1206 domain-containing protein [Deltaproteobacteria bacterium]